MLGQRVSAAPWPFVTEKQHVARAPAHLEIGFDEGCLAPFIIFVQIDESGPRPRVFDALEEIEMRLVLLARCLAQHLQWLTLVVGRATCLGETPVEGVDCGILKQPAESGPVRRAD